MSGRCCQCLSCDTPLVCRLALVLIGVGNQRGVRVRVRASASLCIAFGFTLTGLGLLLVCYSQLGGPIGRSQAVRTHASVLEDDERKKVT